MTSGRMAAPALAHRFVRLETLGRTLADRPLLETPLRDWTYAALDQFLDARIREDERIEYKEQFSDATFTDTLVSMANGDGGYIFVGVSERQSLPVGWPLLDAGKNHALTAYNKAGSETSPPVRIDARPFPKPGGDGREVLVVRVEPGDNPPYFAKNRGVKVRVGESDVLADPRALEHLFARRDQFTSARDRLRHQLGGHWGLGQDQVRLEYRLLVAPPLSTVTFSLNDLSTRTIRDSVWQSALGSRGHEARNTYGYHFGPVDRRFSVLSSGQLRYNFVSFAPLSDHIISGLNLSPNDSDIDFITLFKDTYSTLKLSEQLFPSLTAYGGPLYVGAAASNLYDRSIKWPEMFYGAIERRAVPEHEDAHIWQNDSAQFAIGDDPLDPTNHVLKSLAWHQGYDNHEAYIDSWGSTLRRKPADT